MTNVGKAQIYVEITFLTVGQIVVEEKALLSQVKLVKAITTLQALDFVPDTRKDGRTVPVVEVVPT